MGRNATPARAAYQDTNALAPAALNGRQKTFVQLIDATEAGRLLGVPSTWVLAQARANRIPHHRLGHYVRFDPEDMARWLEETRSGNGTGRRA
jgi:excisionase family DNA binding protein